MEKKFLVIFIDDTSVRLTKDELVDMINACMDNVHGHNYIKTIETIY